MFEHWWLIKTTNGTRRFNNPVVWLKKSIHTINNNSTADTPEVNGVDEK